MASEETICPREFPPFLDILRQKIGDVEALKYFDVHINADVKHAQDLTRICYEYCRENNIPIDEVYKYQEQDMQNNIRFYDDLMS
jgi:pyrroloquinoline quinone (PQQ) biosynthesis protein C